MIMNSILETIGQTPIIKLNKFNRNPFCNLFVKCEMFNPSLSIKDRIVINMIRDFEKSGRLNSQSTIIEASSGNTGSSLAMIAAVLDYRAVITVPGKTSQEKIQTMRRFGAEVIVCFSVHKDSDDHYMNKAVQIEATTPNSILLGQYESLVNVKTHYQYTAAEIWEQMQGQIDYYIAVASSGGTISGIASYLKEQNPNIRVIMADPVGSVFYEYFHHGTVSQSSSYSVEGAGKDSVCSIHHFSLIDDVVQFTDENAYSSMEKIARIEGILVGESSGGALYVAEQLSLKLTSRERNNIVVVLPDSGFKYLSKTGRVFTGIEPSRK